MSHLESTASVGSFFSWAGVSRPRTQPSALVSFLITRRVQVVIPITSVHSKASQNRVLFRRRLVLPWVRDCKLVSPGRLAVVLPDVRVALIWDVSWVASIDDDIGDLLSKLITALRLCVTHLLFELIPWRFTLYEPAPIWSVIRITSVHCPDAISRRSDIKRFWTQFRDRL